MNIKLTNVMQMYLRWTKDFLNVNYCRQKIFVENGNLSGLEHEKH